LSFDSQGKLIQLPLIFFWFFLSFGHQELYGFTLEGLICSKV
jgi:hypothetical protein